MSKSCCCCFRACPIFNRGAVVTVSCKFAVVGKNTMPSARGDSQASMACAMYRSEKMASVPVSTCFAATAEFLARAMALAKRGKKKKKNCCQALLHM